MDGARLLAGDCEVFPMEHRGRRGLYIRNRRRLADGGVYIPEEFAIVLSLLDGERTLEEVCQLAEGLSRRIVEEILLTLDGIYLLDNDRSRSRRRAVVAEFLASSIREPICAGGVYFDDAVQLSEQIDLMYSEVGGPGRAKAFDERSPSPRCLLSPHIDYRRGGQSFAWSFKELAERSSASIYVIVATSHHSLSRFVMTAKDFRTPLGIARTHRDFVDLVADVYGSECFADEFSHQPEHSIELMLPLLQHARSGRPDYRIVPLLVGSFGDVIDDGICPSRMEEVSRMIAALISAEEACGEKTCYIVSGDLAHLGPKFGDRALVDESSSQTCRVEDLHFLSQAETADPAKVFEEIHQDQDRRRTCGFSPLWVALSAARPSRGKLLCYDQYVDPRGSELVSFASMVFEQ
jgi:AmmeMemoRadiSam system protein B